MNVQDKPELISLSPREINGRKLVYFFRCCSLQKPTSVIDTIAHYYNLSIPIFIEESHLSRTGYPVILRHLIEQFVIWEHLPSKSRFALGQTEMVASTFGGNLSRR
jgi:hypothetical protein